MLIIPWGLDIWQTPKSRKTYAWFSPCISLTAIFVARAWKWSAFLWLARIWHIISH